MSNGNSGVHVSAVRSEVSNAIEKIETLDGTFGKFLNLMADRDPKRKRVFYIILDFLDCVP